MNWKECFLQRRRTITGGKAVAVNVVLGYAEDEVADRPNTSPQDLPTAMSKKTPPGLESFRMGPHIRIMTRCITTWPISGLAPETLAWPGRIRFPGSGDDFDRFWLRGGPRAGEGMM